MMPWRLLLARTAAVGAIVGVFVASAVFVGMKLAGADPTGPPTRGDFTFAGVLHNADGGVTTEPVTLTFVFHRMGFSDCTAYPTTPTTVTPNASGAFSVLVPIRMCGPGFFDGTDITYDVFRAGEVPPIVSGVPMTPVPYARFSDQADTSRRVRFVQSRPAPHFDYDERDAGAADPMVPGLSVTLPTSGTYLLLFNARCFATGRGQTGTRDDQNAIELVVGGRRIVRQALPGRISEDQSQRSNDISIITRYTASAGDVVGVRLHVLTGRVEVSATEGDDARLIAIPMAEGL